MIVKGSLHQYADGGAACVWCGAVPVAGDDTRSCIERDFYAPGRPRVSAVADTDVIFRRIQEIRAERDAALQRTEDD